MTMIGLGAGFVIGGVILVIPLAVTNTRFWHRRYHRNADHRYGCDHCWREWEESRG